VVFAENMDYEYYLDTLREFKEYYDVRVYAFCLMTNHVHLLLEPETAAGLGQLMKRLAGRQTRFVNRQENRSGTLWESRYKSSPVQTDTYLLACLRYIELNPVRARMVSEPDEYPWCSYTYHAGQSARYNWLDTDPCYLGLGRSPVERASHYISHVKSALPDDEWVLIRESVQRGQLTGNQRFIKEVETITGRRIECRAPGRPRRMNEK